MFGGTTIISPIISFLIVSTSCSGNRWFPRRSCHGSLARSSLGRERCAATNDPFSLDEVLEAECSCKSDCPVEALCGNNVEERYREGRFLLLLSERELGYSMVSKQW